MVLVRVINRYVMVFLVGAFGLVAVGSPATAGPYFNSSEPGCDGSDPNVLFCDDFERDGFGKTPGTWWVVDGDNSTPAGGFADPRNKGWGGNIPPTGTGFPNPAGAVACGAGVTPFGSCAAFAGNYGTRAFGGGNMALRHFKTPTCGSTGAELCNVNEIYVRWYIKWDAGYLWGNEKNMNITTSDGDIAFADITFTCGKGTPTATASPGIAVNYGSLNGDTGCGPQNQGNDITMLSGRWYFFELHVRVGSNALVELWVNDCGVAGTSCGAAPILRTRYTGNLPGNANGSQIQTVWLENWTGIASTGGGPYWDQIKASTIGPIGLAGTSGNTTPSPVGTLTIK